MNKNSGFTLIELLIYIALFAIVIGGVLSSVFYISEGADRTQARIKLQQEGAFLLAKINWALTGLESITTPTLGASEEYLFVQKYDVGNVSISRNAGDDTIIEIEVGGASSIPLNNSAVKLTSLDFSHQGSIDGSESVRAEFTLLIKTNRGQEISQDFSTERFLRK